jgi:hypothetical protein
VQDRSTVGTAKEVSLMSARYYGTNVSIRLPDAIKERLGVKPWHDQHRVVCKAKSRAEANRIAEASGLGRNVFRPDYTSGTRNDEEIAACDLHVIVLFPLHTHKAYVTVEEALRKTEGVV